METIDYAGKRVYTNAPFPVKSEDLVAAERMLAI